MAVDKEDTLVLVRVLNEVSVELVVERELDKEETAEEVEVLNALSEVVKEETDVLVVLERVLRLFAIEFSAVTAREFSVARAVDKDTLFVLVEVERTTNPKFNELT